MYDPITLAVVAAVIVSALASGMSRRSVTPAARWIAATAKMFRVRGNASAEWDDQLCVLALECPRCGRLAHPKSSDPCAYSCPSCGDAFDVAFPPPPPQPPVRLGAFKVLGVSGRWRSGWLYSGIDERNGRAALLKVLSAEAAGDPAAYPRFRSEARVTAALNHPNITTIWEIDEYDGTLVMAFEPLRGVSLRQCMAKGCSLDSGLPIVLQALDGLACVHGLGIVHRDIGPESLFVCEDGRVKITDFSLARVDPPGAPRAASGTALLASQLSQLSPELVLADPFDHRCDLFSMGCVLYELLAGRKPFTGDTVNALLHDIVHGEPSMAALPNGPEWQRLRGVVARSLQKRPEARYPDARAMQDDLQAALAELGGSASWMAPRSEDTRRPME